MPIYGSVVLVSHAKCYCVGINTNEKFASGFIGSTNQVDSVMQ